MKTDIDKIEELFNRGVFEIIGKDRIKERMLSGEKLRIKFGVDPTSPNLHLGRAVPLLKLFDFQKLGHKVILLIGNATGVVGDTSDKDAERPMLTHDDVTLNMKTYIDQASKILNMNKVEVVYNADWLDKLGYREIGSHADAFSLHEFISRENIKKRLDAGKRISLREVLYPLMQGYDSVAIEADVELGGSDQRFNLLAGRKLQEKFKQEPQGIIMTNLIMGTDGRKMSSSWGNVVALTDSSDDMGEKLMNLPDEQIVTYFEHCTRISNSNLKEILKIEDKRIQKLELAYTIIEIYHGKEEALEKKKYLNNKFITKKNIETVVKEVELDIDSKLINVMVDIGGARSKGDARRKIEQYAVSVDGIKIKDVDYEISSLDNNLILKIGKKFFRKIIVN